jgi:hypothetical protein
MLLDRPRIVFDRRRTQDSRMRLRLKYEFLRFTNVRIVHGLDVLLKTRRGADGAQLTRK